MWIESHQTLARHPKTLRLAGLLKINKAQAIGHLHLLWWWTLDYAPEGDLSAFTSCEIGAAAEWTGNADGFMEAIKTAGWLDEDLHVHDWHDYAGKLVEKRKADAQRKRAVRGKSDGHPEDGEKTAHVTVPNLTKPTKNTPPPPASGEFEKFWLAYPRKEGKRAALAKWTQLRPPLAQCLAAIEVQRQSERWREERGRFIPMPAAWLHQGRWEDAPKVEIGKRPTPQVIIETAIPDPEWWQDFRDEHPDAPAHFAQLSKPDQEKAINWNFAREATRLRDLRKETLHR